MQDDTYPEEPPIFTKWIENRLHTFPKCAEKRFYLSEARGQPLSRSLK